MSDNTRLDPAVPRLALLQDCLQRPTSATQRFVAQPAIAALTAEWRLGEDPAGYTWKDGRRAPTPPEVRRVVSLPTPRTITSYSQPLPPFRPASSQTLPLSSSNNPFADRDTQSLPLTSTQGVAGPYGSRNVAFSRRKVVKKRTTGF